MQAYLHCVPDRNAAMREGFSWVMNVGKQSYKFPEDRRKNRWRCNLCENMTYPAETITYNCVPYHKSCFRCVYCTKKQNGANVSPIGDNIFSCSNHLSKVMEMGKKNGEIKFAADKESRHQKQELKEEIDIEAELKKGIEWRAKGNKQAYRFPEDACGPKMRLDPRCQKCAKTVYPAEKFTYERIPYHRKCVRCLQCNRLIGPSESTPISETRFLCNAHYEKIVANVERISNNIAASRRTASHRQFTTSEDMSEGIEWLKNGKKQSYRFPEDSKGKLNPKCQYCGKTSYSAETVTYNRIPYHNFCLRCYRCGKKLSAGDANPFGEKVFLCNNHYQNIVFLLGNDLAGLSKKENVATTTRNCRPVRDVNWIDPRMYEGYAWRVAKGRQTYKYPEDNKPGVTPRCNACGKKSYPAETLTYERVPYHKRCMKCLRCSKKIGPANATPFGEDVFLCNIHFSQYGQGDGLPAKNGEPGGSDKGSDPSKKSSPTGNRARRTDEEVDESKLTPSQLRRHQRRQARLARLRASKD